MDRENRINNIIDRLEKLTIEAKDLTQELRHLQSPAAATAPPSNTYDHPYRIGDKVIITNAYLGKKGICGTVTAISAKRVTLTDASGRKHTRKPTNIKYE